MAEERNGVLKEVIEVNGCEGRLEYEYVGIWKGLLGTGAMLETQDS